MERKIKDCQIACDKDPSSKNLNDLEILQTDYDRVYEFITQGAIVRSRATWCEYGEKSNKYFLNLENSRKKKSCIRKLNTENDKSTTNPNEILNEIQLFYANLYDKKGDHSDENLIDPFLSTVNTGKLTDEQRDSIDKQLTMSECFTALKTFKKNKTPGNDGLTVEFYLLSFWPLVGKCLVECLNFAHRHGELSTSQKQAMITLIEKKDKDKRLLKNWRPISLINMDVKIASKVMAMRLESILPFLVHHSQNAFIKGRSIFDAIRTIDDILEYAKRNSRTGILVAIDFEKAFDSLNRTFLESKLQLYSIKRTINMWRWRGLTLLGRIQIVKTFAIPKFMYKASLISVSEDLIKDVNKLLYGFIWKGNDKIKRTALINDIENGGLKMLDVQSMILSQ